MNASKSVTAIWRTDVTQLLIILSAAVLVISVWTGVKIARKNDRRKAVALIVVVGLLLSGLFALNQTGLFAFQTPVEEITVPQDSLIFLSPKDGDKPEMLGMVKFKVKDVQRLTDLGADHVQIKIDQQTVTTFLPDEGRRPATIYFNRETGEGFFYYAGGTNGTQTISLVLATKSLRQFPESEVAITIRGNIFPLVGANGANG